MLDCLHLYHAKLLLHRNGQWEKHGITNTDPCFFSHVVFQDLFSSIPRSFIPENLVFFPAGSSPPSSEKNAAVFSDHTGASIIANYFAVHSGGPLGGFRLPVSLTDILPKDHPAHTSRPASPSPAAPSSNPAAAHPSQQQEASDSDSSESEQEDDVSDSASDSETPATSGVPPPAILHYFFWF
jgi:hypothetical protein